LPFEGTHKLFDPVHASPSGDVKKKKEINMRRKLAWLTLISAAMVGTAIYSRKALATPASGFVGTTLAVGRFGEIDVF
jgi:hypothetical protein